MSANALLRSLWLMAVAIPALAGAQEEFAKPEDPSVNKLELVADKLIDKGKVALVGGTADAEGLKFSVPSLSILQPVFVRLIAAQSGDDLRIELFKSDWTQPERSGTTAQSGFADFLFRTQGVLNARITGASAGTPFYLLVWAGEELRPPMTDVIVTPAQFKQTNPGATDVQQDGSGAAVPLFVWIAAAAMAGGAIVFFVLNRGRR
jgi:hypothetical protein